MATAEVHPDATLTPGKLDLLADWLPGQSWFDGDASRLERVAAYRFVDPDGEVGIETLLVTDGEGTWQVPLTYRGEPVEDELAVLVGTMNHSVLGERYVYDATSDPVYVTELLRVIREGDREADLSGAAPVSMHVRGSGTTLVSNAAAAALRLARNLAEPPEASGAIGVLDGTWTQDGAERTALLAVLR